MKSMPQGATKQKENNTIWLYHGYPEQDPPPSRNVGDDFDLSRDNECFKSFSNTNKLIGDYKKLVYDKLRITKLKEISLPPISNNIPHILNLKQEFTFPQSSFAITRDDFTQTVSAIENRIKTPYPYAAIQDLIEDQSPSRLQAFSMEKQPNHNDVEYKRQIIDDCNYEKGKIPKEFIGEGIEDNLKQVNCNLYDFEEKEQRDLEMAKNLPCESSIKRVIVKSKNPSTPKYKCKKINHRPQSKVQLNNRVTSCDESDQSTAVIPFQSGDLTEVSNPSQQSKTSAESDKSIDFCNISGNHYIKMSAIIEQLQDIEWEVCIFGLRDFSKIASEINWKSEIGARFIPIVSRKLIDFFKSPRSNLCRTACQVAGDFFHFAKSTKRPEFDEMVDILLCKTADPNRFIQKNANTALDKMASSVSIHHSVRAICAKGSSHKNPIVRSAVARILTEICRKAGNDQIFGIHANATTRKRVLANLASFLLDKNIETRRNGEELFRLLKNHKFFMEYFFKDIEHNFKPQLKKILTQFD